MGDLPPGEFQFHASVIYASGGMLLSGDDLTKISADRLAMLKKLVPPTGKAAEFSDDSLRIGIINLPDSCVVCIFNWEDKPQTINVPLPRPARITDFWTGEVLGLREGSLTIKDLPPRSARMLVCK
jgi:alpha-galactosidase